MTDPNPLPSHDRYDRYDPSTSLTPRQQRPSSHQRPSTSHHDPEADAASLLSTPSSQRGLRRTPRFSQSPSPGGSQHQHSPSGPDRFSKVASPRHVHIAAVSPGINPRLALATAGTTHPPTDPPTATRPPPQTPPRPRPASEAQTPSGSPSRPQSQILSDQDEEEREDDQSFAAHQSSSHASGLEPSAVDLDQSDIHPAVRISKRTHNAILFAIEALTHPYALSPDYEEEQASMADLLTEESAGAPGSNGHGNGLASPRPQAPPAQTSSPRSNIRGPRIIMQERQEREARRAEQERQQRAQAEQETRMAEQRRQAERERVAAAAAAAAVAVATAGATTGTRNISTAHPPQQTDPAVQRRQQRAERAAAGQPISGQTGPAAQPPASQQQQQPTQRPVRVLPPAQAPPPLASTVPAATTQAPPISGRQPPTAGVAAGAGISAGVSGAPLQSGDASGAAGGNRPRNSFPHAFERWEALSAHWEGLTSFWIRQLQQRTEEIDQDPLSRQLARQVTDLSAAGANLFHAVVELQRLRASSERKFQRWFFEMRGDMERNTERQAMLENALQEERRDRAEAIREAVETERSNSKAQKQLAEMRKELAISKEEARRAWEELGRREQEERDRLVALQEGLPTIVGGMQVVPMTHGLSGRHRVPSSGHGSQTTQSTQPAQTTQTAPLTPQGQQTQSARQPSPASPARSAVELLPSQQRSPRYTTQPPAAPEVSQAETSPRSEAAFTEGEEEEAQYGTPSSLPPAGTAYPPSSSQHFYAPQPPVDYSGQDFAAPWETIPRHQHPTRLSDVIEEDDERSRTSASQVSRG